MTELSKVHRAVTVPLMLSVMFSHIQSTYLFKKSPLTSLLASNNLLKPTPDFYSKQQIINNSQSSIPKQTINQRIIRCTNKSYPFIPFYLIFDKIFLLLPLFFYCRLSWAFFTKPPSLFNREYGQWNERPTCPRTIAGNGLCLSSVSVFTITTYYCTKYVSTFLVLSSSYSSM